MTMNLVMNLDDLFVSMPVASREQAVETVYEHLLGHFPDYPDLAGLPEPITEGDLRSAIDNLELGDRASFSINSA